ncbi:MAG: GAF domain-containing protein [Anaerolineae bacterium]|nr:GAF domain-containing protein [Anaerolineae bacterium]
MSSDIQTFRHLQQENIRLRDQNNSLKDYVDRLQQAVRALIGLQDNLDRITSETDIYSLIHRILASSIAAVGSENGSLMLLDEESNELVFVDVIGATRDELIHHRLKAGIGIAGWVVTNRTPKLVEDVRRDPHFSSSVDRKTGFQTSSLICLPLLDGERVLGALEVVNTISGRPFTESDKDIMLLVARLASMALVTAERAQPN